MESDNYTSVNKALVVLKSGVTELPYTVNEGNQDETKTKLETMATNINTALGKQPASEAASAEPSSNDWEEKTDPSSNQQYYVNKKTGESKWDMPPLPPSSATSIGTLPSGWIEKIDESSGNPYYVNTSTKESTWDKPASGGNKKRHRGKSKRRYKRGRGKYSRRRRI